MHDFLNNVHMIRPLWLLALVPLAYILWRHRQQQRTADQFQGIIAPHLVEHLVVKPQGPSRLQPIQLFFAACLLMIIALAGPAWKREPLPFAEDQASLVIALDLSDSMNTQDVQPSRLERAKHKIRDLLSLRAGARTGLVVYAGSAHMVLPLTDDPNILETYMGSLSTDIMPAPGKDAGAALQQAQQMLASETVAGTVLLVTDEIYADDAETIRDFVKNNNHALLGLSITYREAPANVDIRWTAVTADDSDVKRLNNRIQSHMQDVRNEDNNQRWQDQGYWLAWPVAGLTLFWFRKGWLLSWG